MEKNKFLLKNIFKLGIVPLFLFSYWVVVTYIYSSLYTGSYAVVSYNHSTENFTSLPTGKLLKGQKIKGEFVAQNNKLGIVAIRFKQQQRIPWKDEDLLIFRIKEKSANAWYYQNEYYSGLTFDVPFLPIGFPVINDSKNKTYYFELESTKGNEKNGLEIGNKWPVLSSRYQINKADLIQYGDSLINFLSFKVINSLNTPDIIFSSVVYLLPLLFYVLWISGLIERITEYINVYLQKRFNISKENAQVLKSYIFHFIFFAIMIGFVIYDIFILQSLDDMLYLTILGLSVYIFIKTKSSPIITFGSVFILLFISSISYEFDNKLIAEKAASWAFIFLVGGVLTEMFALRKMKK